MPELIVKKLSLTDPQWSVLTSALFAGRKIEAIKLIRDFVPGTGLAEAKSYMEQIENDLRQTQPEKFTGGRDTTPIGAGRILLILFLLVVVGFVVFMLVHK